MTDQERLFAEGVRRQVTLRLIPLLILIYVLAHLDRVNVSFAALTMNEDLGFSDAIYGLGAGLFFFGYFLFEVPANKLLERIGARRLIGSIMLVWGAVSAAMATVGTPFEFYVMRFVLGVAESGLYPGIILYLTYWFRDRDRATASAIMDGMGGVAGLASWQWLFIVEGVPTVLLGLVVLMILPDRPAQAHWLTPAQRTWLEDTLQAERGAGQCCPGGIRPRIPDRSDYDRA